MTQLRDLTPPPLYDKIGTTREGFPRRRPKPQRTWPRMVMGALAMYGVFSLVVHAVVAWEVLR